MRAAWFRLPDVRTWEQLSGVEQQVLILASEEAMLWEVCAALGPDSDTHNAVAAGQRVTAALAREGLLWFYRLAEGNPSLTEAEVVDLFNATDRWLRDEAAGTVAGICLFPTDAGDGLLHPDR
jgi:hypothetical protein